MSVGDGREQLQHRIGRYLENDLPEEETLQLESLLSRSEPARRELLMMALLHQELFELAEKPARRSPRKVPPQRPSRFPWMIAAAVLAAVVGVALLCSESAPREVPVVARPPRPKDPVPEVRVSPPVARPEVKQTAPPVPVPLPLPRPVQPEPEPPLPPPPVPEPAAPKPVEPAPVKETIVAVATIDQVEGQVKVGGEAVQAGQPLASGQGLQTLGRDGRARLRFKDGTILEVVGETEIREISDLGGKRVAIVSGEVAAEVARQPADQPMVFTAPQGTTTVLGTSLRLIVDAGTRLQVLEGKARLKRASDGKQVDVPGGNYALIAAGASFAVRPMPRNLLLDPGFEKGGRGWRTGPNHYLAPKYVRAGRSDSLALETSVDQNRSVCDVFQDVPVKAGVEVRAAAWVRTQNVLTPGGVPGSAVVRLVWMDARGKELLREEVGRVGSSQNWTPRAARFRAPDQAATARFQLFVENGAGTIWMDDCELIPLERF